MEIFQTIWTALTTENELLTSIVIIPVGILEMSVNMLLFTTILNIDSNRETKIKYIIVASLLANLINIIIPNPYKSYANVLICPILIVLFFVFCDEFLEILEHELVVINLARGQCKQNNKEFVHFKFIYWVYITFR